MMHVQLPDRKDITLCEAVTAFVYGAPRDSSPEPFDESDHASLALEKELLAAAIAGKVRFHGLKAEDNKYQEIDPRYFSTRHHIDFNWSRNLIRCRRVPEWHNVHLDREQYASLLNDMRVSVEPPPDLDVQGKRKSSNTGSPGRPTSRHLVENEVRRRLNAGEDPESLAALSRELAAWLRETEPEMAPMKPRSVENAIRPLLRAHQKHH
jgi:hypothetical protein